MWDPAPSRIASAAMADIDALVHRARTSLERDRQALQHCAYELALHSSGLKLKLTATET